MIVRREIRVQGLSEPISHYTDAVRFGRLLFISGCASLNSRQEVVGVGDLEMQVEQAFKNLEEILVAADANFSDVLKVTLFMTDCSKRTIVTPIRQRYFKESRPASTLIGVSGLAFPDLEFEIEAVARLRLLRRFR
jgi:2-iminobutanoate/2-iminopropanoate deaminase